MPRNASGVYSLPNPPVVTDTTILSNDENVTRDDLAAEITNSLDRNGRGGMLAPFRIFDGTLATPGLAFLNEINSGLYRAGANDIRLAVAAADIIKFTPSAVTISAGLSLNVPSIVVGGPLFVTNGVIQSGGANSIVLRPGGFECVTLISIPSAVNYLVGVGSASGGAVQWGAGGADLDIALNLISRGADPISFFTQGGGVEQARILNSAGPNFLTIVGGVNPTIGTNAGELVFSNAGTIRGRFTGSTVNDGALFVGPLGRAFLAQTDLGDVTFGGIAGTNSVSCYVNDIKQFQVTGSGAGPNHVTVTSGANPIIGVSAGSLAITAPAVVISNGVLILNSGGDNQIGPLTADGADTARVFLSGGGAYGDIARGSYIAVQGNEAAGAGSIQYAVGAIGGALHQFYGSGGVLALTVGGAGPNHFTLTGAADPTIGVSGGTLLLSSSVNLAQTKELNLLGSAASNFGRLSYSSGGNTLLAIDNAFNDANAEIRLRTRTTGAAVTLLSASQNLMVMGTAGTAMQMPRLAGVGTRTVVADASGVLSAP